MNPSHRKSTRTPRRLIGLVGALVLAGAALVGSGAAQATVIEYPGPGPVEQPYPLQLTGRAYGIGITDTKILGAPVPDGFTPDTGYVSTTQSEVFTEECGNVPGGYVTAALLCPKIVADARFGSVTSTQSVATARVGIPNLPVIEATGVEATSSTSCGGSQGATTIAYLKVGTKVVIAKPTTIAPNTTIPVGPVTLVLNEQTSTLSGLRVNAIRVSANVLGLVKTSVVVSSAESGVGGCGILTPGLD